MNHSFDVELATEYGVLEAILLANFEYWIAKNAANDVNYHDGYYWTYNSTKAFGELFPYYTQRQIQNALKHLRDLDIIQTGNFNQSKYDRTLWYAFTEKGKCIMQKCKMDFPDKENPNAEKVKPIPNTRQNINTNIKQDICASVNETAEDRQVKSDELSFDECWNIYPRKAGKKQAFVAYKKAIKNGVDGETILNGIKAYNDYIRREKIPQQYIKMGSTWFNGECWNDDYGQTQRDDTLDAIF